MGNPYDNDTRILVVDDERDIRDGCERVLTRMGYQVFQASQGLEALEVLTKEDPSIVLLDLKMPGMDGIQVLRRIREIDETILVIVITGYATVETAIEAMKQGAYDFISKPFSPDQLRIAVGRAMEKLQLTREAEEFELERKRTLVDLDTEKSRISTIIESLPNGVVVTNAQGQVVLMNPAFRRHLGLDPETKPGEQVETYISDQEICSLVRDLSQGRQTDPDESPTCEFPQQNGKHLLARGRSIMGEENECLGAVLILVDITTVKVLDQLKSEFVAKVSHELRSPLSTIHEQLALVLRDHVGNGFEDDQHILARAKEKTQGLISLIGDLLDLSRIEAGIICHEPKPVRIEKLLRNITDFLESKARNKDQALILDIRDNSLPPVMADPIALESVFGNLITNAINYTPQGGEIRIMAELDDGKKMSVAVQDNGFGMEAAQLDKIFDKFFRIKNDKTRYITGTGLGLSIVKGLLEGLNGSITVQSAPDKGSTFKVLLPVQG